MKKNKDQGEAKPLTAVEMQRGVMPDAVTGYVEFSVTLDCPHCENELDLTQHPFDGDCDKYRDLGAALFGGRETPAKWEGVDIKYECTHCKKSFVLGQLEY